MENIEVYLKYRESIHEIRYLFNHYEKYNACISIRSFDNDMNEIIKKMGRAYSKLLLLVNNETTVQDSFEDMADMIACEFDEILYKNKVVIIEKVNNFIESNRDNIINILNNTHDFRKISYLDAFELALTDARKLVSDMDMLIKKSQNIYPSYLRASA